ncbi:hypothetical protein B0H14DRAFT_2625596 [Mycena olivaceomarginata]|nr:hypothetical protein B0H14DRAFT_2625596 [Mycena olivaceomarginata]
MYPFILTLSSRRSSRRSKFLLKLMGPPGIVVCGQLLRAKINFDTSFPGPSGGVVQAAHIRDHHDIFGPHNAFYVVTCRCQIAAITEPAFFQRIFLGCSTMDYRPSAQRRNVFRSICVEYKNRLSDAFLRSQPMEMDVADHRRVCSGWNTLLTPQVFEFNTHIEGGELDLSSSLISPMLSSGALDNCVFNSSFLLAFTVGETERGTGESAALPLSLLPWGCRSTAFIFAAGLPHPLSYCRCAAAAPQQVFHSL